MIISDCSHSRDSSFEEILNQTVNSLRSISANRTNEFEKMSPTNFEKKVYEIIRKSALDTKFKNSFELISGQRFPDIVSRLKNKKFGYGIEVKKTIKNHWETIGNSIMEGNRVDNIEKIFLFFGKLNSPMDFKFKPYEECLSDVKITHSPRYFINMDIPTDETIFSKVGKSYEEIRNLPNPFQPIKEYLRETLRESGEEVWWVDENEESGGDAYVKLWENLSINEKKLFQCKMMGLFPEIFGNAARKYGRATSWLASRYGIVSHALRDTFTAGSNVTLNVDGTDYENISKLFCRLQNNIPRIKSELELFSTEEIKNYWKYDIEKSDRFEFWTEKVVEESELFLNAKNMKLPVKKLIEEKN
tara:strand:+ start:607 stop:1686 length:1080 start_codon:yes stop_codon:yes gene_type:complete